MTRTHAARLVSTHSPEEADATLQPEVLEPLLELDVLEETPLVLSWLAATRFEALSARRFAAVLANFAARSIQSLLRVVSCKSKSFIRRHAFDRVPNFNFSFSGVWLR